MEENMVKIKHNWKTTQDKQKIYANKVKVAREFIIGEHVYLKLGQRKVP